MITKTFKLTVATDTEEQMQKEEEHLSMVYGAEEVEEEERQPCEDCISRQAVLDVLKDEWNMFSDANDAIQESIDTIEALPPVTPQPRTGHWIRCDILQEFKCSECRKCFRHKTNFCPNCGAKMKEAEDAESN